MYSLSWLYVTAHLAKAQDSVVGDGACQQECEAAYADPTMIDLCNTACLEQPELFHVDFPYIFGPLTVQPYPNLTNADPTELEDLTGTLWARVNVDRNRMQFMYEMDSNPEPFFPYFAMHLHQGNLNAEEIGGDLVGCFLPAAQGGDGPPDLQLCSEKCTVGSTDRGNCVNPGLTQPEPLEACPVCDLTLAYAYFCPGGCQGDGRIVGNSTVNPVAGQMQNQTVVPSRFCDIGGNNPSNAVQ
ncbi:expressed unknown protein [Seminavis robusta]|uniref:Uncharacterized protein n=1 Tax=Seminavis robusta TaxID=568900 RepID=A0A9N8EFU4_9STRA|nr:expressed unknown protein [Seminavis robusta]|eukprot:Sro928_g221230.1 n/a (242) ;mRNA; f:16490-17337